MPRHKGERSGVVWVDWRIGCISQWGGRHQAPVLETGLRDGPRPGPKFGLNSRGQRQMQREGVQGQQASTFS